MATIGDTCEVLEKAGVEAFKDSVIQKIQNFVDDLKPRFNSENDDQRKKYFIKNAINAMEFLIKEASAVVIPDDETQLDNVNKTLIHILDEFGCVHETVSKIEMIRTNEPCNRFSRWDPKYLRIDFGGRDKGEYMIFLSLEALELEIALLAYRIEKGVGFGMHLTLFAKESLVALKKRLDDMQISFPVVPAEIQAAELTDILTEALGVYDAALRCLPKPTY